MAYKQFTSPHFGEFTIYKRKGVRSLRLSITSKGEIRVSQPTWLPYAAGVEFAAGKTTWIAQHRAPAKPQLYDGQRLGKNYYLRFLPASGPAIKTRLIGNEATVYLSPGTNETAASGQQAAIKVAERALKKECEDLLFTRLKELAAEHDFTYKTVSAKKLSGRWGSCSNQKHITLNIFLLELPWPLIDYVLLHELVHTKHLHHGADFWSCFEHCQPDAKNFRKAIRAHKPAIGG
ncbi:MAG: YgjP-like metallopeptidase domain-containing protein [Candidatus Saccharimonadales bacterium]